MGHEGHLVSRSHTRRKGPRNAQVGRILRAIQQVAKADKKRSFAQLRAAKEYAALRRPVPMFEKGELLVGSVKVGTLAATFRMALKAA